ncbi:zinc finger protein-like protein [Leptotrombidium deliense]|uniref:Zinc finger protein-like protein n=1 Tax=Leptotrombidium deliense TaxID=299467 RepID=A0A443SWQ3_9ACAR|nr:zinc finger protein-like protein [Leptotrombidium deliense]
MSSTLANHYICPDDLSPLPTTQFNKVESAFNAFNAVDGIQWHFDGSDCSRVLIKAATLLSDCCSSDKHCVYLQLDAKKSPLALLAQTCSNIGADLLPNNKPIIPPLQKPKKSSTERSESVSSQSKNNFADNRSNSVGSVDTKISFKPYETNHSGNKSNKSDTCESRSNSVDVIVDKKFPDQRQSSPKTVDSKSASSNNQDSTSRVTPKSTSSNSSGSTPLLYSSSGLSELSKSQLTTFSKSDSLSTACRTTSSLVNCMNGYSNYPSLNASAAALRHNDLMKSSHYSSSLLSPYLNQAYAAAAINSIKAASVCRDPYCKGCQISAATALNANMSCANGCNGCVHSMHSHPLQPSFLPPSLASFASPTANAGLASARPLVCNWTVAGQYCGKSFATCEELLQHLKSHTTNSNGSSPGPGAGIPGFGSYYPPTGLPPSLASISALRSPPNHALDSYRYHPYKPTLPGSVPPPIAQASAAHLSSLTAAPLAGYYPAYNLYNGRL